MSIAEKIAGIEAEMARTQKNKNTNKHLGLLKAKLSRLKKDQIDQAIKGGGGGEGFDVSKTGIARVGMVGFPSVGKSTLLVQLTDAESKVADYEFTTLTCIPGLLRYMGAKIQLLDLPGIIEGANDNKGRGRQVIAVARTCDCILLILDATKPLTYKRKLEYELEGFGIRLNKRKPNIEIKKTKLGGISIQQVVKLTKMDEDTVKSVCYEYKLTNCNVCFHQDATVDELIDVIQGNRIYIPAVYVLNKIDEITIEELECVCKLPKSVPVCAKWNWNLDSLLKQLWKELDLIRIYTKPKGEIPDFNEPVILPRKRCSVLDFCKNIHRDLATNFKYAMVWGTSAKHTPQKVGKKHILQDEDVVQIVKKI